MSVSIDAALRDPNLLGAALGNAETWEPWLGVLRAAFGLELDAAHFEVFRNVAGDRQPPKERVRELWAILGRRSGKSRMAAAVAAYLAAFVDHKDKLSAGETGTVLVLAASKAQAATVFGYARAFFEESDVLCQSVDSITSDEIRLTNRTTICVHTNSYRTLRGRTLVAAVFDEVAFWRDETSTMPDVETYRAVLPALATTNGMLIGISSPYAQRGLLYSKHKDSFGQDDPATLVIKAPTTIFNPTIDTQVIDRARHDDPEAAASEWDAEFRGDLCTFVDRAVVEACVDQNVRERPCQARFRYVAFVDPSGGAHDSMTLAIGHRDNDMSILDCTREIRPPFSPADVVGEFVRVLQTYRIRSVTGDRYAGSWVSDAFKEHGIRYVASERSRSEIYMDALPMLMASTCTLLDDDRLVSQIAQLERRTSRSGRDSIDHQRSSSDDLANAVLGALTCVPSVNRNRRSAPPKVILGYANAKRGHRSRMHRSRHTTR